MNVITEIEQNWSNDGVSLYSGSNLHYLLEALSKAFDNLATDTQDIYDAQHIDTATGEELDKFGRMVRLPRVSGESDDKYRIRIKLQFRLNFISGTFDEVAEFILVLLDANTTQVEFEQKFNADPGALYIRAQGIVYENSPLTKQEIVDFASRVVPAGHAVKIEEEGTFVLIEDGDTVNDPATGLTSDGSPSTGGTLSSTL